MTTNRTLKQTIEFDSGCRLFIGAKACDATFGRLALSGTVRPLVIIAADRHRNRAKTLLTNAIASEAVVLTVGVDDCSEEVLVEQYKNNACDLVVACGNQTALHTAQLVQERLSPLKRPIDLWIPFGAHDPDPGAASAIAIDPRFANLSCVEELTAIAASACFHMATSFIEDDHIFMEAWVATGWTSLSRGLELLDGSLVRRQGGFDIMTGAFIAALCAHNRGRQPVSALADALAIPGWTTIHEARAALTVAVLALAKRDRGQRYDELAAAVYPSDPLEFSRTVIDRAGFSDKVAVIGQVCANGTVLLRDAQTNAALVSLFTALVEAQEASRRVT